MKLYVDLGTLDLIEAPGFRNPVSALRFKRGDAAPLEVVFLTDGTTPTAIGNPSSLELHFGVKARGRYDAGYLVHASDWTKPAPDAENPIYSCSPSFNTVELNAMLGLGSPATESSEVTLMGEITWRVGGGLPTSTRTFVVVVENDVNRGTEGPPAAAFPPYPMPDQVATLAHLAETALVVPYESPAGATATGRARIFFINSPDTMWFLPQGRSGDMAWKLFPVGTSGGGSEPQVTYATIDSYENTMSIGVVVAGRQYRLRIDGFSSVPVEVAYFGLGYVGSGSASVSVLSSSDSGHVSATLNGDAGIQMAHYSSPADPGDIWVEFVFVAETSFDYQGYAYYGEYASGLSINVTFTITEL